MRKIFIICSLWLIAFSSCKELDKKQLQLSPKSKKYQKELLAFKNDKNGIHYVKFDTIKYILTIKHDFEKSTIQEVMDFIKKNELEVVKTNENTVKQTVIQKADSIKNDSLSKDSVH